MVLASPAAYVDEQDSPTPFHAAAASTSAGGNPSGAMQQQQHRHQHQQQHQRRHMPDTQPQLQQQPGTGQLHSWSNGLKLATAGGLAGAFAKSCTAPLARLTILYQVQGFSAAQQPHAPHGAVAAPPKLRHAFMQVVRSEGPAALWKGNLATILHRLPYSSINFYTYEQCNKLLGRRLPPDTNFLRTWMSGGLAGLVACTAAYPLDLVRTRLAAQTQGTYYHGIWPTLTRIVADEGVAGLYSGLGATLLQVVPSLALNFALYDTIRSSCMVLYTRMRHSHSQRLQAAAAAAAAPSTGSSGSAHSLAVASSVDQGLSLSQMLLWHLDDAQDVAAAAVGSGAGGSSSSNGGGGGDRALRAATVAAVAAEDAYHHSSRTAAVSSSSNSSPTAASSSSTSSSTSSSSSSARVRGADVPAVISLASGCVSGFLTATATFPLDVIRRRMQVHGRQQQQQQHHGGRGSGGGHTLPPGVGGVSYRQIMRQVMGQGRGLAGFYVGILPEYCKVVPGVAIAFCTYEQLKKWMHVE